VHRDDHLDDADRAIVWVQLHGHPVRHHDDRIIRGSAVERCNIVIDKNSWI
jgi:hypothetical protein